MNPQNNELTKLFKVLIDINDNFAAIADAKFNLFKRREIVVTVDEGGKTLYAATLELDKEGLEAKARLIRHELEQMQVAALAGRLECAA
mgnify:CR=1 FL=1